MRVLISRIPHSLRSSPKNSIIVPSDSLLDSGIVLELTPGIELIEHFAQDQRVHTRMLSAFAQKWCHSMCRILHQEYVTGRQALELEVTSDVRLELNFLQPASEGSLRKSREAWAASW